MRVGYLNKVKIEENLPAVNFTLFNAYALSQAGAECFLFIQSSNKDYQLQILYQNFHLETLENFHIKIIPQKKYLGIKTNQWFYFTAYNEILNSEDNVYVYSRYNGKLIHKFNLQAQHLLSFAVNNFLN